jgi:FkbM family methyltransferase
VRAFAPWQAVQAARVTRRLLAGAPVPEGWTRAAVATQARLAAGAARRADGLVHVRVGDYDVAGFSVSSLAYLHSEIFVKLAYYFRARRPDPFVVDGGSNIGMSVLFFKALYPAARVLAFEPAEPAHRVLRANVERNRLEGIEVHAAALGRGHGEVPFYDDPEDPATFRMSTRAERLPRRRATTVPQRRLSEFLDEPVDLVKLDVEGAEEDVLADLVESGAIARVEQLVVEYHHHLDPARDFLGAFLERLRAQGFRYQLAARERVARRAALTPQHQDVLVHAYRPAGAA